MTAHVNHDSFMTLCATCNLQDPSISSAVANLSILTHDVVVWADVTAWLMISCPDMTWMDSHQILTLTQSLILDILLVKKSQ